LIKPALQPAHEMQWNRHDQAGARRSKRRTLILHEQLAERLAQQLIVHRLEAQTGVAQFALVAAQTDSGIEPMMLMLAS
jgi:hypothetical protein